MQPILKVDLTTQTTTPFEVPAAWHRQYLGASALAARLLYDHLVPDLDPLSPAAPLLFLTGPLTGTAGPATGRFVICGRSPATGLWAESNCGGFWGPELRKAGYAGLWLTGKAAQPVYLWLQDNALEFRAAAHFWGQTTHQTQAAILNELDAPNPRVAVIGPAGEAQIPLALILTDHGRVAGRTGLGALMGSKNLKAIAIKGTGRVPFAEEIYTIQRAEANRALKTDNMTQAMRELGSAGAADYLDYLGDMPKKYFQAGTFDGVYNITGATMAETILKKNKACHACVVACGREVRLPGDDTTQKGPEYETIAGFGPNLLIDDLEFITRMNQLCDGYGLDSISVSNIIGLAFTLFENGLIDSQTADGLPLVWGDQPAVEKLVHKIAQRDGFGDLLAQGAFALAQKFGVPELAVQINGLEVAYHDPRAATGMALVYLTSPRGACHNQSDYFVTDLLGQTDEDLGIEFFDRHAGAEKAQNIVNHQNWRTLFNALVICFFANVPSKTVLELVNTTTGAGYTLAELQQIGERAWNLKRIINYRLGLRPDAEKLPQLLRQPYPDGGAAGFSIPVEALLAAYYTARGWQPETGLPNPAKRRSLGLDWCLGLP